MAYATAAAFPLYAVDKPPYTVEVPGAQPVPGETIPRRHPKYRDALIERPAPDVDTVFALLRRSATLHGNEPALASRKFIGIHKETKKVSKVVDGEARLVDKEWTFFELSGYSYQTYGDFFRVLRQVGCGLRRLGLARKDRVHIFAATSPQWMTVAHAAASQSLAIVTAYDALGEAGVRHSLTQTGAVAMFVDPHLLSTASGPLKAAPSVRYVIYNEASHQPVPPAEIDAFRAAHPHLRVLSFEELRALGEDADGQPATPPDPPAPDDIFCIMYTSGSTGLPKGVPVTHASFVAAVAGLYSVIGHCVSPREQIMAYLPLAHIFELVVENLVFFVGATLGYGSTRTLTDTSMKKGCPGDLRAFRPTVLVGVPQVWETVRKGVVSGVEAAGPIARSLFWSHVALKTALVKTGLLWGPVAKAISIMDNVVFARVRTTTGGRLRFIVNGASTLSSDTKQFLSLVIAPMINGYGLTETGGNGSLGSPLQWTLGPAIGGVSGALEVKLVSHPTLGYRADPAPGSGADPHGEILFRGKPILAGYYENAEATAEALTADGWFRTGDIGAFDASGHLRIVDRVKNLVKMQGGEYVALERLEAVYRGASTVQNIMVCADAHHTRPVGLVCLNEKGLEALAAKHGITAADSGSGAAVPLYQNPKLRVLVLKELVAVGKAAGLTPIELLQDVALVEEEWTPASGAVTATQKLNRRTLSQMYAKEIEAAFAK